MDNTFALVSKVYHDMENFLLKELNKSGLSGIVSSHGKILYVLFDNDEMLMSEIAQKIEKTPQTVTTLVKKLEDFGFVISRKSETDKRATVVSLTEKGYSLKSTFDRISEKLYDIQYENLNESEIELFSKLLYKVSCNFAKEQI